MRIGIIAGNRLFPLLLARTIKQNYPQIQLTIIGFKGETNPGLRHYADKMILLPIGKLGLLRETIKEQGLPKWILAGQITPVRIFFRKNWDQELHDLVNQNEDFRPHVIFPQLINYLEKTGINFIDSTLYLKDFLAQEGLMNKVTLPESLLKDVELGINLVSRYVELDVGQTVVVKSGSVVALESLDGTDRTIKRGAKLAGKGCIIFKYSKTNQDLRFDVPVVGTQTVRLLKRIGAAALVLEPEKVLILEKKRVLDYANCAKIAVLGKSKSLNIK